MGSTLGPISALPCSLEARSEDKDFGPPTRGNVKYEYHNLLNMLNNKIENQWEIHENFGKE